MATSRAAGVAALEGEGGQRRGGGLGGVGVGEAHGMLLFHVSAQYGPSDTARRRPTCRRAAGPRSTRCAAAARPAATARRARRATPGAAGASPARPPAPARAARSPAACGLVAPALSASACASASARAASSAASRRARASGAPATKNSAGDAAVPGQAERAVQQPRDRPRRCGRAPARRPAPRCAAAGCRARRAGRRPAGRARSTSQPIISAPGASSSAQAVLGPAAAVADGFERQPFEPRAGGQRAGACAAAPARPRCGRSGSRRAW